MPKYYKKALSLALLTSSSSTCSAFQASRTAPLHKQLQLVSGPGSIPIHHSHHYQGTNSNSVRVSSSNRSASVSASYNDESTSSSDSSGVGALTSIPSLGEKVRTVTVAYIDSMSYDDDAQGFIDDDEVAMAKEKKAAAAAAGKRRVLLDAATDGQLTFSYKAQIPITAAAATQASTVGMVLKEVNNGIVSEMSLPLTNMNALRYVSNEEEIIQLQNSKKECTTDDKGEVGTIQIINEKCPSIRNVKQGIVVSSIERGSLAWDLGIRAGDMVVATSATVGDVSAQKSLLFKFLYISRLSSHHITVHIPISLSVSRSLMLPPLTNP